MAVTINASTTAGLVQTADTSGVLALQTAGTTAVTVDASQNVGIGVIPSAWTLGKAIEVSSLGTAMWSSGAGSTSLSAGMYYNSGWKYANGTSKPSLMDFDDAGKITFYTVTSTGTAGNAVSLSATTTIDNSGNLLVGGTTQRDSAKITNEFSGNGMSFFCVPNTSAVDFAIFRANAGTLCGAISRVGTTGAVVYTATSDYRLKENVMPMTGALEKVAALKPVTFTWKDGGADAEGFIAHEFAEVCPHGVIGEKDGVDENADPKYQAMDSSVAIPILTAAIQEQQSLITALTAQITAQQTSLDSLTARITALEAK
jgi:hypothetical protein